MPFPGNPSTPPVGGDIAPWQSRQSPFPPIGEYGFLSDREVSALVGPERERRVALPPTPRQPQRVQRHPRPGSRRVPARAGRAARACRSSLPSRHQCPGDHLADTVGLAHRARRVGDGPMGRHRRPSRGVPPSARRLRSAAHVGARGPLHPGTGRADPELRAGVRLRAHRRALGVHGRGLRGGGGPRRSRRSLPASHHEHAPGHGGACRRRVHPAERRRGRVRRADVGRRGAPTAGRPRGSVGADPRDRRLLARLAQQGRVPRPPVARASATGGPDAERPHLRPHRRADRRLHHLVARDAGRGAELGLPLQLGARRHVRALGPLHLGLRLRSEQLLLLHRRSGLRRVAAAGDVRAWAERPTSPR